jgi:hypothetical protein
VREFEERQAPRWLKLGLSTGSGLLLATGFFVGVVLRSMLIGVLLFALGTILFAVRGYLNTGDKAVAGALIFVALVAAPLWVATSLHLSSHQDLHASAVQRLPRSVPYPCPRLPEVGRPLRNLVARENDQIKPILPSA